VKINSYSEVCALGHKAVENIFDGGLIVVEEKVDGSQFSMSIIDGVLCCRSKGKEQGGDEAIVDKLFSKAVAMAESLKDILHPNWIYRCEFLDKPKHNVLCYSRVPKGNLIIYDIDTADQCYLAPQEKRIECDRIGLECVPCLAMNIKFTLDDFKVMLDAESCLGGTKIEGVVIKNYRIFGRDKKVVMGKYVSETFKEKHNKEWKVGNPSGGDVVQMLGIELKTEARWQKAIQHLTESDLLVGEPKDIGLLMKEVPADIEKEEAEYIKDKLFQWAWPQIKRIVVSGLPEFYKEKLAQNQKGIEQ
jgi:hypothetical protein